MRYGTDEELDILKRALLSVFGSTFNFFQPQMKLKEKTGQEKQGKGRYDQPKSPYQRVHKSPCVDEEEKKKLKRQLLNPTLPGLRREILDL